MQSKKWQDRAEWWGKELGGEWYWEVGSTEVKRGRVTGSAVGGRSPPTPRLQRWEGDLWRAVLQYASACSESWMLKMSELWVHDAYLMQWQQECQCHWEWQWLRRKWLIKSTRSRRDPSLTPSYSAQLLFIFGQVIRSLQASSSSTPARK